MNRNKNKILALLASALMLCTACDDKLDIVPLGKTTLDTVDDLETLLNQTPLLYMEDNEFYRFSYT